MVLGWCSVVVLMLVLVLVCGDLGVCVGVRCLCLVAAFVGTPEYMFCAVWCVVLGVGSVAGVDI